MNLQKLLKLIDEKQANVVKSRRTQFGIAVNDDIHASFWQRLEYLRQLVLRKLGARNDGARITRKEAGQARRRIRKHYGK